MGGLPLEPQFQTSSQVVLAPKVSSSFCQNGKPSENHIPGLHWVQCLCLQSSHLWQWPEQPCSSRKTSWNSHCHHGPREENTHKIIQPPVSFLHVEGSGSGRSVHANSHTHPFTPPHSSTHKNRLTHSVTCTCHPYDYIITYSSLHMHMLSHPLIHTHWPAHTLIAYATPSYMCSHSLANPQSPLTCIHKSKHKHWSVAQWYTDCLVFHSHFGIPENRAVNIR
jgi:hypothetical protein